MHFGEASLIDQIGPPNLHLSWNADATSCRAAALYFCSQIYGDADTSLRTAMNSHGWTNQPGPAHFQLTSEGSRGGPTLSVTGQSSQYVRLDMLWDSGYVTFFQRLVLPKYMQA